ncbi:MAG: hypothetical protein LBT16_07030 [Treponema sp.]|nr:hypothetical protein [Treponema sp.]
MGQGEKAMFLGLTPFVRPSIMDIGGTINSFFYTTERPFMQVEEPVKIARGRYRIRCIQSAEYTDDKVYIIFDFLRNREDSALIQTVTAQAGGKQEVAKDFETIMFVLMSLFSAR